MGKFRRSVRVTYGLFLLACLGLVLDLLLGTIRSSGIDRLRERTQPLFRERSEAFHHGLKPSVSVETAWNRRTYRMATNSMGFRDFAPREASLQPSSPRVLFIGDSFAEGLGRDYEGSALGIVSRTIRDRELEAENAGVTSYCPLFYYLKVRDLLDKGFRFDHLVVLIDVSDIHDETLYDSDGNAVRELASEPSGQVSQTQSGRGSFSSFLERHTIASYRAFLKVSDWTRGKKATLPRFGVGFARALWTSDSGLWAAYGKTGMDRAQEHMDRLAELLEKERIGLSVVVYPWPDQIYRNDRDSVQVKVWSEWARAHKARFLNLFPDFFGAGDPLDRIEAFFDVPDFHWSDRGQKLVATRLLAHLDSVGWEKVRRGPP